MFGMNPAEFETPEGQARWRILRAMLQALASQANWVGTLSNWALGTTGVYVGLLVANFDAIAKHVPYPSRFPVFWFALISALFGIVIQVLRGAVQFWINIVSSEDFAGFPFKGILAYPPNHRFAEQV
jgi:hypothetical protein